MASVPDSMAKGGGRGLGLGICVCSGGGQQWVLGLAFAGMYMVVEARSEHLCGSRGQGLIVDT